MNECVFLGTIWCQNNVLSSTLSSKYRMTIKTFDKFDIVLIRGYVNMASEMTSLLYFEMLFQINPTKSILYSINHHVAWFMQYNLQNRFLMIIFVFIFKLDACCCLNFLHRLKDTVTILKFSSIYELFSNRRFHRDNAQDVYSLSLTYNYRVWILLFWGQTWWVIPMTSSILVSKDLTKNRKKWFSQNSINKSKFRLRICFYIINISNDIFFDSPKPYKEGQEIHHGVKMA